MTDKQSTKETTANLTAELNDASQWLSQYARMNAELLQTALKSAAPLMTAWGNWYQSLLPVQMKVASVPGTSKQSSCAGDQSSCCEIPETSCPPRVACTIHWDASVREVRVASIGIRNTSKDSVTYTLTTQPYENGGTTSAVSPVIATPSVTAAAGQTVHVEIGTVVTDAFQPGSTWHSEILVTGKYERSVKVELHVRPAETCTFDLGDIPYRTKADEWYRHFQCSSPCFAPVQAPPVTTNPVGVVVEPEGPNPTANNPTGVVVEPQTQTHPG
jgi:hypothetical protein